MIETHVLRWLERDAEAYSSANSNQPQRLIEPWLDDDERTSRAARK